MITRHSIYIPPPKRRSIVRMAFNLAVGIVFLITISFASIVLLAVIAAFMGALK
jgi:hypothetical protein